MSGRSIPNRETASSNVIRGHGGGGTAKPSACEHRAHHRLHAVDHVVLVDERHLEVELGELGLAVGAQVLVAEAAGDLVVALEAADHQQLLEQLRRLRQRVERAGLDPRRDEDSRARPRASSESGTGVSISRKSRSSRTSRIVAITRWRSAIAPLHLGAPQVERAVLRRRLSSTDAVLVERERRRLGVGEDLELASTVSSISPVARFGLTFCGVATRDRARDRDHVLGAQRWAAACAAGAVSGMEDELDDPGAVAQVDEDQAAVVAAAVDPAGDAGAASPRARRSAAPHHASR